MEDLTTQELEELVDIIEDSSETDRDELLTDMLIRPYPTKRSQDN